MSKAIAFWLIYIVFLLIALYFTWPMGIGMSGTIIVLFILVGLVGWAQFGAPIQ